MQNELAVDDFLQPDDPRMVAEGLMFIAQLLNPVYSLHVILRHYRSF